MVGQKESLPEAGRHPDGERPGDQQAEADIGPYRGHVHPEVVTDRGKGAPAEEAAPSRAPPVCAMPTAACPSTRPRKPRSACRRASSTIGWRKVQRKSSARITIIK